MNLIVLFVITYIASLLPCARRRARVKRSGASVGRCVCVCVCVSSKNTAVYCLTVQKAPQNIFITLGRAIHILRKMPTKSLETCV